MARYTVRVPGSTAFSTCSTLSQAKQDLRAAHSMGLRTAVIVDEADGLTVRDGRVWDAHGGVWTPGPTVRARTDAGLLRACIGRPMAGTWSA